VASAHITVPAESTHIVESKSFKLYLNSFNASRFVDVQAVRDCMRDDLDTALWHGGKILARCGVKIILPEEFDKEPVHELDGLNLDRMDIECRHYQPAPELLNAQHDEAPVSETFVSHLLKSNCLVTGQPDWGSVSISYSGAQMDQAGLLQYIVSFRNHNEFHEHCVERIYMDIMRRCQPTKLCVQARYTRRGGVDINPWRSSHPQAMPPQIRTARQ
jgi:7-cyano-7-deazaguanine reductase